MEQVDPLAELFAVAKQHRIPMAAICARANVDPTTPSRWRRKKNGATVEKLTALHGALRSMLAEQAAA